MGKLVEKLQQVSQATGNGFGFLGRSQSAGRKPRPAAVFVTLDAGDVAAAEAAVKAGADGVIISGWTPGADLAKVKAVLATGSTLLGVAYAGKHADADGALKAALEAGAAFALAGAEAPAALLFDEIEQLDVVVTGEAPRDDLGRVLLRAENLLPAQAAVIQLPEGTAALDRLTVSEFARLRLVFEAIRFPALVDVTGELPAAAVKALVRLGADGLILAGAGSKADTLGKQVQALCAALEAIPVRESNRSSVAIGGFMASAGESLMPRRPAPPSPEPDEE